jgi:hypothetical protein
MGVSNLVVSAAGLSSAIKSIQRGVAVSAGNITITSVDVSKTRVSSFSTGATGSVAVTGNVAAANGNIAAAALNVGAMNGSSALNSFSRGGGNSGINIGNYTTGGLLINAASGSVNFSGGSGNVAASGIGLNSQSISAGATDLVTAVYGAYLSNSTTLVVTGPCRYEVVEHF